MSKLESLLQELCPDGVEYRPISEFVEKVKNIKWKDIDNQSFQYIDLSSVDRDNHRITETNIITKENAPSRAQQIVQSGDILFGTTRPLLKRFCMIDQSYDKQICSTGFCVLRVKQDVLYNRFLYHLISTKDFYSYIEKNQKGASYPAVSDAIVRAYEIPVPPLPVQEEIVRILDQFMQLQNTISIELELRKKQFIYHREKLLDFSDKTVLKVPLGEIALVTKLAGFEFTKYVKYSNQGEIIALRGLNVKNGRLELNDVKYIDESDFSKLTRSKLMINDMLFTYVGTIGEVALIEQNDKFYLAPNVALIRCKDERILPKFLRYYFQSDLFFKTQINRLLQASSMKNIPMEKIRKFEIPLPSIEKQKHIISILDSFDMLCYNDEIGLPAEIAARQKQFEYYRDKLLTFKARA